MTNNNKPHDYLLTFWFTGGNPEHLISRGLNEEKALQLAKEIKGNLPENIKIEKLSDILKVTTKEVTIQEIMKTSFSEDHLINSINLFEIMIIQGKIHLQKFLEIFSPYGYCKGNDDHDIDLLKTANFQLAPSSAEESLSGEFPMINFGLRFLPKKKQPFGHDNHRYYIISQRIGKVEEYKRRIMFKSFTGEDIKFKDFLMETKKLIPDFPIRLEKVMISSL